jgi:8-oxo-dGTP pyrophosphatase MutT (NUDIX family)
MQQVTFCLLVKEEKGEKRYLLAMKKRGFGEGKWNGPGGKFDQSKGDKNLIDTAIRETKEEIALTIENPEEIATLSFEFPHKLEWSQEVYVYIVKTWQGEPVESEEMKPKWFQEKNIPYEQMWEADKFWLPYVIRGKKFKARFIYNEENKVVGKELQFFINKN